MSNRWVVFCIFLAGFCFISWKHSLIGVGDALKLAGRGLIFLGIFTWLIHIFPGLKFFFFPVCQELPDSPLHESGRLKQERVRRIQQHNHNDKTSVYVETVLKPRQTSLLKQKIERNHRMSGEMWKLGQGFSVGGEENQTHDDVDETPNERSKRKRKPLQTAAQDPVQQEVPKHKKEVTVIVLPEEPSEDTDGVVKIALRCPSGRTVYRRFLKTWSSLLLLDWMKKSGYHPVLYTLCTSYPRKALLPTADVSLEEAGIFMDTVLNIESKVPSTT
ncbi:UBX domain-containing protein 8 isoform X1 [Xyrauchen texanus]|uniref:UBX domain-containing protein 8 isoform X1 n=1 Tax=Xyrauchen texanus TaxID=154827 RepID=UPI002242A334|nr:UBX domain-containing protein 8 isoform X1 [Xyrauchen texanus]